MCHAKVLIVTYKARTLDALRPFPSHSLLTNAAGPRLTRPPSHRPLPPPASRRRMPSELIAPSSCTAGAVALLAAPACPARPSAAAVQVAPVTCVFAMYCRWEGRPRADRHHRIRTTAGLCCIDSPCRAAPATHVPIAHLAPELRRRSKDRATAAEHCCRFVAVVGTPPPVSTTT